MDNNLISLIKNFQIAGDIQTISAFGKGHINTTYKVITDKNQYILQEINTNAFKNVDVLMNNINVVTSFIRSKGEHSLEFIPGIDGRLYVCFENRYYRVYKFIDHVSCFETVGDDLSLVAKLGEAFGKFHLLLSDLNPTLVKDTIIDFHNTPKRFLNFSSAYVASSIEKRNKAKKEINYILNHNKTYSEIVDGLKRKQIKEHITHNDPKINNILFKENTNEVLCVIDLDTVMPGSVLYDIGDAFRSLFTGENEDNEDLSLQKVKPDIFRAYMKAYLSQMKDVLTKKEIELIPYSIYLMTIECGMRFLEDYLRGNVYFHVDYEEHNLIRSRTQIALAEDVLKNSNLLNSIIEEIMEELKHE